MTRTPSKIQKMTATVYAILALLLLTAASQISPPNSQANPKAALDNNQQDTPTINIHPQAVSATIAWLELIDSAQYQASWKQAAPLFQNQLSSQQWTQALMQVRKPLGKLRSRKAIHVSAVSSLPGAPDGEYVIITLAADFQNKNAAIETATVSKVEGEWRSIGYFIR